MKTRKVDALYEVWCQACADEAHPDAYGLLFTTRFEDLAGSIVDSHTDFRGHHAEIREAKA